MSSGTASPLLGHARALILLTAVSVVLAALLGIVSWTLKPNPVTEALAVFGLPALWGLFEAGCASGTHLRGTDSRRRMMRLFVLWLAFCTILDTGPELAIFRGLLDADLLAVSHMVQGVFVALSMVLWGNYLPKLVSPWNVVDEPFDWQRVHRFAGRVSVLGGVLAVALWMILPYEKARPLSTAVVVTASILIVGFRWAAPQNLRSA